MITRTQRLISFALAAALATPLSLSAETRRTERTDMRRFAAYAAAPPIVTAMVDDMNRERAARGLKPLRLNRQLSLAADDRVADMLSKHYFGHVSPDGMEPWTWVDRRGYDYREIGENLAVGYGSAGAVVDGWMRSPGHRANILGRDFDEVGIAVAPRSPMRGYAAPLVVALYGTR